jgi:hypothetical protein
MIPEDMAPALCRANLTPLRKKDGGVRPIAVGEILRRLVGKAILSTGVAKEEVSSLTPDQVGVGVPRAVETVGIGFATLLEHFGPHSNSWAMAQIDVQSAYQEVSRLCVLQGARRDTPSLYNFLRLAYTHTAPLYASGRTLYSESVVHQGCPLGPVAFSVAIQDLIRHITAHMGLIWNVWYLDDGLLVGSPENISTALAYLEAELLKRGLRLNRSKSNLWGPAADQVTGSEGMQIIPWHPNTGVTILGSPVSFPGSSAYVEEEWQRRLTTLEEAADRVTGLADKQMAHHLLRSCLDGCKVNHLLRATDTYQLGLLVQRADDIIMSAFEDVVGCGLSPERRLQASWPFSAGGCGLKTPSMLRPAARVSALAAYLGSGSERLCLPN